MTRQEVAEYFKVSENYVRAKFEKFQKNVIKKYGIKVIKKKDLKGKNIYFFEKSPLSRIDLPIEERVVSIIGEPPGKKIFIDVDWLGLDEFSFMLLIALLCMPHAQFKGSIMNFMKYAGIKEVDDKITLAKGAFIELSLRDLVAFSYMKGDEILVRVVLPKLEEGGRYIFFTVGQVIQCVRLSLKYGLRSWSNYLKVRLSKRVLKDDYSILSIAEMTNVRSEEILRCLDALKESVVEKSL